ncbi:MAG: type II secretion system F family protein [Planctomycetota bacterium]
MSLFFYEGVDRTGKKVQGDIEAASVQEATTKVRKLGYFPTSVKDKASVPSQQAAATAAPRKKKTSWLLSGVSQQQLTQFTVQLHTLQDAGLPILRSLKILANQMKPSQMKDIVENIAEDVESGSTLSDAISRHPKVFDRLYVNMVKAGEAGGVLDTVLARLAVFMEKAQGLKRKVIGALTYPAVVITVAILIVAVIMIKVVPQFKMIFQQTSGKGLPAITQLLMDISSTIAAVWFLIPVIPIGLYLIYIGVNQTPKGRLFLDKVKLRLPLVGIIIRKSSIARFTRTLGTLLASGVAILEALVIVRNAIGNEEIALAVQSVHDSIREGESIVGPLSQSAVFDSMVINMIEVGEESGELDKMLMKIADNYESEVDTLVGALTSILEPAIIVFLAVIVGFIVIALFYPLVDLMKNLG